MLYWYFSFSIHRYNVLHVLRSQSLPGLLFFLCVWSLVFIVQACVMRSKALEQCFPVGGSHSL